jgi:hypothetical protein
VKAIHTLRSAVLAYWRVVQRKGIRNFVKAAFERAKAFLLKALGVLALAMIAFAIIPFLPPAHQSSAVRWLGKVGVPNVVLPKDPHAVKYKVSLDPDLGTGFVNDLFQFGASSTTAPVLYDRSDFPNILVCHPWEHSGAGMNEILNAFIAAHPSCFVANKREPNGITLAVRRPGASTIRRPDGSTLAVACECKSDEAVQKTLQKAGMR